MAPPVRSAAFLPVRHLKGLEQFPEAERSLLEQLNAIRQDLARLQARPVFTELKTGDYLSREEEFVRYAPGTGGATLMLPTPRPENKGSRVTLLLENVTLGSLTVQCVGGLVNRLTRETLSSVCRVDFVCDGLAGWVSEIALSILAGAGLSYTAGALAVNGSTSITITSDQVQRAALTGDVTSPANSNATTLSNALVAPNHLALLAASVGAIFAVHATFAAGAGGSADDVTIFSTNAPVGFLSLHIIARISTAVLGSTVTVRDAAAGGGNALSTAMSSAATGVVQTNSSLPHSIAANGSLFVRRSDSGVAGAVTIIAIRN